jgi:hypothetical protein
VKTSIDRPKYEGLYCCAKKNIVLSFDPIGNVHLKLAHDVKGGSLSWGLVYIAETFGTHKSGYNPSRTSTSTPRTAPSPFWIPELL